jgi:hypothetical protein
VKVTAAAASRDSNDEAKIGATRRLYVAVYVTVFVTVRASWAARDCG